MPTYYPPTRSSVASHASKSPYTQSYQTTPTPEPLNPDADIRRLVTINPATGEVTELLALETANTYLSVKDSFTVKPAERKPSEAGSGRRYQGTRIVSETHGNAAVAWKVLVKGPTADDVASNIETLIAKFEGLLNQPDVFIEWVPVGASFSTYYEVRGPAKWQPTYQWAQFFGTKGMYCDLEVPVGPLARGARVVQNVGDITAPCTVDLDPVGGTAPALASVSLAKGSGGDNPAFGLLAWWNTLPAPPSGYSQCFGLAEAESAYYLNQFSSTSNAIYHGGAAITVDTSSATSPARARYAVSTDGLTGRSVDIEVWGRVVVASATVSPRLIVSAGPRGVSGGAEIFTNEHGQAGAPVIYASGTSGGIVKLGTLTLPVRGVSPLWWAKLDLTWGAGSSGSFVVDWLMLVPAGQRACSPTDEPLDEAYPRFMGSGTGGGGKIVLPDLAGRAFDNTGVTLPLDLDPGDPDPPELGAGTGLGGSLLEFPTGDVTLAVITSACVPGSTGTDAKTMSLTAGVELLERHFLLAGA